MGNVICCARYRAGTPLQKAIVTGCPTAKLRPAENGTDQQQLKRSTTDDVSGLPECPKIGCSLRFLQDFAETEQPVPLGLAARELHGGDMWSMGDICSSIIKPRTLNQEDCGNALENAMSYAELSLQKNLKDSRGNPAFAKATHFVSHAWRYDFRGFVAALRQWMVANDIEEDDTYFWVDCFVVNQHQTQSYPQKWWSTRFMQAIAEMGNVVLLLDPWDAPVPLTRAWCLWEIYCTAVTGARLHLAMRPQALQEFKTALLASFDTVQTALSRVDVSQSTAFHRADQDMIHNEIKRTIGFIKMNELVQTRLMHWLMETAKKELDGMKTLTEPESVADRRRLQANLAQMLRERGNVVDAEELLRDLVAELEEKLGKDDLTTLSCSNQLAVTLQKSGKTAEALEMHRSIFERRRVVFGPEHEETVQSASNLAVLLSQQKPMTLQAFTEAEELFDFAKRQREAALGADNPRTLYTMINMGKLLSESPESSPERMAQAEALHDHAVSKLSEVLEPFHPLTLHARHNQACHWLLRSKYEMSAGLKSKDDLKTKAMAELRAVWDTRVEKLGREHPDTLATDEVIKAQLKHLSTGDAPWKEFSTDTFPEMRTTDQFRALRQALHEYGVERLREDLVMAGIVDGDSDQLTLRTQPFNIFARIAAGVQTQPAMVDEQAKLGKYQDRYMVVSNKPECDEKWDSADLAWVGKASMSKRHRLLIVKDLHWEWFNVLTFGVVSGLQEGIARLEEIKNAALTYIRAGKEWPPEEHVGLFLHAHGHNSVNALHLHVVDMRHCGPTYAKLEHKNLPIDCAIEVLKDELIRSTAFRGWVELTKV